jgi:hypothetical protein
MPLVVDEAILQINLKCRYFFYFILYGVLSGNAMYICEDNND